ncbi:MAG: GNAT family N-acetyltransferase [Methanomassiliicoccales archaeon]|nr:GNAT family N-acetyltransferase [Methanomassiliicoccales archaeon]
MSDISEAGRDEFIITEVDPRCAESIDLQWEMRRELDRRYDMVTIGNPPLEQFRAPRAVFLIAWSAGSPVGCGAFKTLNENIAEVKRVFVKEAFRRNGLARQIMQDLERRAVAYGYKSIFLESGERQPEALSLYESLGYERVPCDGKVPCEDWSVCFEKTL